MLRPEGRLRNSRRNTKCCNDPNLWHSYDNKSTEQEVGELIAAFTRALQPELVVETGSLFGYTSRMIGQALRQNGHGRLVTIEPIRHRFRKTRSRCHGLPVQCVHGTSLEWLPEKEEAIGLAFFDSSYEAREEEFNHFRPYMTHYTVVAWHDSDIEESVAETVRKLEREGRIQPLWLPTPRGICFARVQDEP